ncbi:hypothetical protein LAZ67_19002705 [Cordylochernes scorpioides]|uniref:Uncharacterized protein n=1 Tax=Cordylochernes scorpioides TaxID=51811 RepID=A0ABY6LLM0_9ARAC|nr:hypothetical protein LAZ67_19002705 [Cordylochernes scorpioides]
MPLSLRLEHYTKHKSSSFLSPLNHIRNASVIKTGSTTRNISLFLSYLHSIILRYQAWVK